MLKYIVVRSSFFFVFPPRYFELKINFVLSSSARCAFNSEKQNGRNLCVRTCTCSEIRCAPNSMQSRLTDSRRKTSLADARFCFAQRADRQTHEHFFRPEENRVCERITTLSRVALHSQLSGWAYSPSLFVSIEISGRSKSFCSF